ncbi:LysR family transcriptional regulator [Nonomuraea sp. NEAU-A123]|uniref:LysR family transcriptional regulator n=1 Tax=Nonomuraea sp. NEAU-A123 TaxID=2839649 RepID=UPI001BE4338C|nr:LysR substrate-binding domain-containing protein [Nonomuraea sp. NEAU-A123]MBT2235084.1 LysR family transcriptional regulator [Nonomuraea sp. NEAU-A123]
MELRQLEYFVAVTEESGFTRAAARLHVAQPGVSAQIRQLERELGQPLFDRSARQVRLTEVGKAVLPYARAALAAVAATRLVVDEITGLLRGHVVMGAVSAPSVLDLPGLLAEFHERHPAVEISLRETDPESLIEAVRAGRMDLGLMGIGSSVPAGLDAQVVLDQALVAAVGLGHDLVGEPAITLSELADRALICLPHGTGLRAALDEACAAAGVTAHVAFEASEPYVLGQLAAKGLGLAVLPESAVAAARDELHVLEITEPGMRGRMALVWRSTGSSGPAARAFIDHARRRLPDFD